MFVSLEIIDKVVIVMYMSCLPSLAKFCNVVQKYRKCKTLTNLHLHLHLRIV